MLDESLNSEAAITRLIAAKGALWGASQAGEIGGACSDALPPPSVCDSPDVPFMIGQMNEGHAATAAALQLCRVVQPAFAELYGRRWINRRSRQRAGIPQWHGRR